MVTHCQLEIRFYQAKISKMCILAVSLLRGLIKDHYPWHLFVSFVGPHDPFDPPKKYAEQHRNAEMPES